MKQACAAWVLCACWALGDADIKTGSGTFLYKAPFISPHAIESGGGSGIFHSLFFVRLKTLTILEFNDSGSTEKRGVKTLERVGRYELGDRYRAARPITFPGNRITIPETDGWFADHPVHTNCCNRARETDLTFFSKQ